MSLLISGAFAEDTAPVASGSEATQVPYELSPEKMMMDNLLILGALFFIFYFILIRPQQKRLKFHRDMLKSLAKGNKVLTSGGLIGAIVKFDGEDVVVLEVSQGVRVRVAKSAISEVLDEKSGAGEGANDN